ncbi:MAG: hypothetical protein MUO58_06960 [Anaerolineales bacterium]|nr:hypothetical protein [Anaerolineales bacterium]HUS85073.1 hypothetical protein [Anaerolineales bacterium]
MMTSVQLIPQVDRRKLRDLVDVHSTSDALAAYYGLEHPSERVSIFGYYPTDQVLSGFMAVASTGLDLFRPLLIPFAATDEAIRALIAEALDSGRPYLIYLPIEQSESLIGLAEIEPIAVTNLLRLDANRFQPVMNVLVQKSEGPGGSPRFEIQSQGEGHASSGINWRSPQSAEIYVESDPSGYRRGFTKSVLAALIQDLLKERIRILFRVADNDYSAFEDAFDLGFSPTNVRTLFAQIRLNHNASSVEVKEIE